MIDIFRHPENPILKPSEKTWEKEAVFNGCIIKERETFTLVYRAVSSPQFYHGLSLELSTIGRALSQDGVHFNLREPFIQPEYDWEIFGCEDPRITKLDDKYFIFYTALSNYPPTPHGIKVGVAITRDLKRIEEKHQATYFNSKAMALFPERIDGKIVAVLTANTDNPPAKIALAFFNEEREIWLKDFWDKWFPKVDQFNLSLQRVPTDHVEVGAPPVKTDSGWLLIYSYIRNYFTPLLTFGVEAVLLDLKNPLKIIGRTQNPLLLPQEEYELYGKVPRIVFPSGAIIQGENLNIYYGAADTTCCLASLKLKDLISEMILEHQVSNKPKKYPPLELKRAEENPILKPNSTEVWESKAVLNPGVIYAGGKTHLLYRAMSQDNTSVLGYASTKDGVHLDERLKDPVYSPREVFEMKASPGNSGCEDPRLTVIGDKIYMCYTAYDGKNPWRVALTSINLSDFLSHRFNWDTPILISPPGIGDKDACLLPEKINGRYMFFHRIEPCIWIDFVDDLAFPQNNWLKGKILMQPRTDKWDSKVIGIGGPPLKTPAGWLLIYHGVSTQDDRYRLGAVLLDLKNPTRLIGRLDDPILSPQTDYENKGQRPGAVFTCGSVILKDELFVYYGVADQVIGVASQNLKKILEEIKSP